MYSRRSEEEDSSSINRKDKHSSTFPTCALFKDCVANTASRDSTACATLTFTAQAAAVWVP
jgi:hypothetical protein